MYFAIRRAIFSELTMWIVFAIIGILYIYPIRQSLRFGSDLVGGLYLTMQVHSEKAVEAELISKLRTITAILQKSKNIVPNSKKIDRESIILMFDNDQQAQEAAQIIASHEPTLKQISERSILTLTFLQKEADRIKADAVARNIEVLRARLDRFSVAEIPIAAQGERNIVIELPDISDPQRAKELIGRAAQLDFRLVDREGASREDLLFEYDGVLPDDKEILPGRFVDGNRMFYVVQKYPEVTGRMLKNATPSLGGDTGVETVVSFSFNQEGADLFYNLTSKNYGRRLAIVLDGEVVQAPSIGAAIKGSGEIKGGFTPESAKTLSLLLKSGSFVAPVTFEEERQIGPMLGQESRDKGILSCLIGLALLFVFSIYFYRLSGLFAFLALVYNLVLILIGMAWFKATLTLPGIAAMVLTIGMAVDASILIYERIKEELLNGMPIPLAVKAGFANAMSVILDANLTTLVTAIVLYNFGSGPIQGFAVTMMIGIVATLITGLFFLRSLFTFMLKNFDIKRLSI